MVHPKLLGACGTSSGYQPSAADPATDRPTSTSPHAQTDEMPPLVSHGLYPAFTS